MDNEAEITNSFVFPSDGLNALLIGQSYSIISFYYKNLETDFSRKVNTPGLLDVGIMNDIKERIISILTKDPCEIEIFDTEFIQLYTWHYIAASCANDKESFFKHFIAKDGGVIKNSESYREWFYDTQTAAVCFYEQKRNLWNPAFEQQKNHLQKIFGILKMDDDERMKNYDL